MGFRIAAAGKGKKSSKSRKKTVIRFYARIIVSFFPAPVKVYGNSKSSHGNCRRQFPCVKGGGSRLQSKRLITNFRASRKFGPSSANSCPGAGCRQAATQTQATGIGEGNSRA
jgi:hypothetical protein